MHAFINVSWPFVANWGTREEASHRLLLQLFIGDGGTLSRCESNVLSKPLVDKAQILL